MDEQHPRSGVVFTDDVLCETRCLLGRRPGAKRLAHRDDVVVDGLGQPNHCQRVAVPGQECGKVGRGGIGVVAADGVQDVDAVGSQPVSRGLQGVNALGNQAALHQVGCIGELDARVSDGDPPKA